MTPQAQALSRQAQTQHLPPQKQEAVPPPLEAPVPVQEPELALPLLVALEAQKAQVLVLRSLLTMRAGSECLLLVSSMEEEGRRRSEVRRRG